MPFTSDCDTAAFLDLFLWRITAFDGEFHRFLFLQVPTGYRFCAALSQELSLRDHKQFKFLCLQNLGIQEGRDSTVDYHTFSHILLASYVNSPIQRLRGLQRIFRPLIQAQCSWRRGCATRRTQPSLPATVPGQ